MNCQEVMELMQRHVDGDLDEQETSRMMNHAGHCPECAGMLERLVRLSRGLEQLPRVVPPYSLVDAILPELGKWDAAGAESEMPGEFSPRSRRVERQPRAWIGRVSAVVALGAVVGLLLMTGTFTGGLGSKHQDASSLSAPADSKVAVMFSENARKSAAADQSAAEAPTADLVKPESGRIDFNKTAPAAPSAEPAPGGGGASGSSGASSGSVHTDTKQLPEAASGTKKPAAVNPPQPSGENGNTGKGITTNPADQTSEPPITMLGEPQQEQAQSPDGRWNAVVTKEGALQLYDLSLNTKVYDQPTDGGKISGLVWKDDSTAVTYTYTDTKGTESTKSLLVSEVEKK